MQQAVEGALAPAGPPSKRPKQLDIRSILGAAGGQRQFVEQPQQGPRWAPAPPPDAAADAAEPAPVPAAEAAAEEEPFNFDFDDDDDDVEEEPEEGSGATTGSGSTWRGKDGNRSFSEFANLAELAFAIVPGSVDPERLFSNMKFLKNPQRNRLVGEHLSACMRMFSQEWFTVASFPYDAAKRAWKASAQFRHSE